MGIRRARGTHVLLAAGLLVGGLNVTAYAATGGVFKLGQGNTASGPSTLENTGTGPALRLRSRASAPPLSVSNSNKVARLNADQVDGVSAAALKTNAIVYSLPPVTGPDHFTVELADLPAGLFYASFTLYIFSDATHLQCSLTDSIEGTNTALNANPARTGLSMSLTASGVVDTAVFRFLRCGANETAIDLKTDWSTVTFIPVNRVVHHAAVLPPEE